MSLVLAHQHLAQLDRSLKEGISANARSKVFFTASPEDARELARHTLPRLGEHDLAHLDVFHAAARLVVAGQQAEPLTLTTSPLPPPTRRRRRRPQRPARTTHQQAAPPAHQPRHRPGPAGGGDPRRAS